MSSLMISVPSDRMATERGGEGRGVFGQHAGREHGPAQQEKKKAHD